MCSIQPRAEPCCQLNNVVAQEEHQVSWHQAGTDFAVSEEYQVLQAVLRELSALGGLGLKLLYHISREEELPEVIIELAFVC